MGKVGEKKEKMLIRVQSIPSKKSYRGGLCLVWIQPVFFFQIIFFSFFLHRTCLWSLCVCFLSTPRGGDAPKGGKKPVFFKTTFFHFFWVQDFKKKVKRNCLFLEARKISRFIVKQSPFLSRQKQKSINQSNQIQKETLGSLTYQWYSIPSSTLRYFFFLRIFLRIFFLFLGGISPCYKEFNIFLWDISPVFF